MGESEDPPRIVSSTNSNGKRIVIVSTISPFEKEKSTHKARAFEGGLLFDGKCHSRVSSDKQSYPLHTNVSGSSRPLRDTLLSAVPAFRDVHASKPSGFGRCMSSPVYWIALFTSLASHLQEYLLNLVSGHVIP